jgi:hypothetical protein
MRSQIASSISAQDHRLDGDAVRGGAGGDAHRMPDRAAAELQHDVLAEVVQQLVHLAGVDATRRDRHDGREAGPVLVEVQPGRGVRDVGALAADVVVAAHVAGIAFELADHRAAWMWSTPISRHHFARTRNDIPWLFWRV